MLKFNRDQFDQIGLCVEEDFTRRLLRHLEQNCPAVALPADPAARLGFARNRIAAARGLGLTWQNTIAEHARLATLRQVKEPVVDPDLLAGSDPLLADTLFAESLRRASVMAQVAGA